MRIGIYGGSFNPVHFGHIGLVSWVREHTDLDEVWMMVSPNNPLKQTSSLADENTRLHEVANAIRSLAGIVACDFEFSLPRPSYTANTLRELRKAYPQHEFVLIIGEDNWEIFDKWREWEYILENYPIIVYPRHSQSTTHSTPSTQHFALSAQHTALCKSVTFLQDAPYFDISSTEIRAARASHTKI